MNKALDTRPRIWRDLIVDRVAGHVVLLHPSAARWAVTNETGLRLAQFFDGTRTIGDAVGELIARHPDVAVPRLEEDVQGFLRQCHDCDLVENDRLPRRAAPPAPPKPPSLTIYVTEQCNLRCKHCAIVEGGMPNSRLSLEDIKRLIDEHTTRHSNPSIGVLGGEPMMRGDCLDILRHAASRTNTVHVSTNGLYITNDEIARALAALEPVNVQVSLDGADAGVHDFIRGRGTYDRTWAAIELLARHGGAPRITLATTLTRAALAQVRRLVDRAEALGIGKLRFLPLARRKAAITHWDAISPDPAEMMAVTRWLLFDAPRRPAQATTQVIGSFPGFVPGVDPDAGPWCPLGATFIVDSQGEVYNCPALMTPEAKIGNIYSTDLESMRSAGKNTTARREAMDRRHVVPECRACAWRNFCQGGCSAFMYHRSGSMVENDEFCDFRRDLYREHVLRSLGGGVNAPGGCPE